MHDTDLVPLVSRRNFVARGSAALATFVLCACGADSTAPSLSGPVVVQLADYPTLAQTGGIVKVQGAAVALERSDASSFIAFSLRCPHEGAEVGVNGGTTPFVCPRHGAQFSASGANTGGQRTGSLSRYAAVYDPAAGTVTIS